MENEYDIPMTEEMEGEVENMCNLSDGVERKGIEKGIAIGIAQGTLSTLCSLVCDNILSIEDAAKRVELTVEEFTTQLDIYKRTK